MTLKNWIIEPKGKQRKRQGNEQMIQVCDGLSIFTPLYYFQRYEGLFTVVSESVAIYLFRHKHSFLHLDT